MGREQPSAYRSPDAGGPWCQGHLCPDLVGLCHSVQYFGTACRQDGVGIETAKTSLIQSLRAGQFCRVLHHRVHSFGHIRLALSRSRTGARPLVIGQPVRYCPRVDSSRCGLTPGMSTVPTRHIEAHIEALLWQRVRDISAHDCRV